MSVAIERRAFQALVAAEREAAAAVEDALTSAEFSGASQQVRALAAEVHRLLSRVMNSGPRTWSISANDCRRLWREKNTTTNATLTRFVRRFPELSRIEGVLSGDPKDES